MSREKGLQLGVPTFQHGQDLGMRPAIHGNGSDTGNIDAIRSVLSSALGAQQNAVGDAGPFGIFSPTIDTLAISMNGTQELEAGWWKWQAIGMMIGGFTARNAVVAAQGLELGGNLSKDGRIFHVL